MSISSTRAVGLQYTGDLKLGISLPNVINVDSPAKLDIIDLSAGNNTITVPTAGGTIPASVTIAPPTGNSAAMTIRGETTDAGIGLHLTDPSVIALDTTVTSFVLGAADAIEGVRLYWA